MTAFLIIQKFTRFSSVNFTEMKKQSHFIGRCLVKCVDIYTRVRRSIGQMRAIHTRSCFHQNQQKIFKQEGGGWRMAIFYALFGSLSRIISGVFCSFCSFLQITLVASAGHPAISDVILKKMSICIFAGADYEIGGRYSRGSRWIREENTWPVPCRLEN